MKSPVILVVDDEPNARNGVAATLREWGGTEATVETAVNGADALEQLRQRRFDLLVTDIRMPVMDGIRLLEEVRSLELLLPCILLTGFAEFAYAQSALRLGAVDYLLKPVRQEQLLEAVEKALAARQQEGISLVLGNGLTGSSDRGLQGPGSGTSSGAPLSSDPGDRGAGQDAVLNPAIAKALIYIKDHIHEGLPIKDVAGHVHLNPSYFSVLFKEEQGINFIDYITEYRLKLAKEMLGSSAMPLDDISEKIGYQTTSYFIKMFKKHTGMTPKHYRDRLREHSKSRRLGGAN